MRRLFVDTSYYIAALMPHDDLHRRAMAVASTLDRATFVTIDSVLVELLAYACERGPRSRQHAVELVDKVRAAANTTVIPQTPELFVDGLRLYRARPDTA